MNQKGTKKLYYKDTHQIDFTATVLSREIAERDVHAVVELLKENRCLA